ncbi:MAG: HTTM domain-containing protein, partial [Bacteroidota bacterium]
YYMTVLLTWVLVFLPANRAFSLDARFKPEIRTTTHPNWIRWFFVIQIGIVYTFASIAKIYPDWLALKPLMIWLPPRSHFYVIGPLFEHTWFLALIAYGGIIFDLLATPLLLWKRTRIPTFIISVLFHLFNSATFHIGIFPYMMIALTLFFFPPEVIRKRFFPARKLQDLPATTLARKDRWMLATAGVYMVIQLALPLRHWFIPGNVTYTEEGHRMSWRMMLRSKTGTIYFKVVDNATGVEENVYPTAFLTDKQARKMSFSPDMCWQFTQFLKKRYEDEGRSVAIYARGAVRLNKGPHYTLYDPYTDLAQVSWNYFWHNDWVPEIIPRNLGQVGVGVV